MKNKIGFKGCEKDIGSTKTGIHLQRVVETGEATEYICDEMCDIGNSTREEVQDQIWWKSRDNVLMMPKLGKSSDWR